MGLGAVRTSQCMGIKYVRANRCLVWLSFIACLLACLGILRRCKGGIVGFSVITHCAAHVMGCALFDSIKFAGGL